MGDFYRPLYLRDKRYSEVNADEIFAEEGESEFGSQESLEDNDGHDLVGHAGGVAMTSTMKSVPHQLYIGTEEN